MPSWSTSDRKFKATRARVGSATSLCGAMKAGRKPSPNGCSVGTIEIPGQYGSADGWFLDSLDQNRSGRHEQGPTYEEDPHDSWAGLLLSGPSQPIPTSPTRLAGLPATTQLLGIVIPSGTTVLGRILTQSLTMQRFPRTAFSPIQILLPSDAACTTVWAPI